MTITMLGPVRTQSGLSLKMDCSYLQSHVEELMVEEMWGLCVYVCVAVSVCM